MNYVIDEKDYRVLYNLIIEMSQYEHIVLRNLNIDQVRVLIPFLAKAEYTNRYNNPADQRLALRYELADPDIANG